MEKSAAVASLGESALLVPAWVRASLAANDRLKLYFTVLQAAVQHAEHPERDGPDLSRERIAAGMRDTWLDAIPIGSEKAGEGTYLIPETSRLLEAISRDLEAMARPCIEGGASGPMRLRVQG